jgi:hypothetical protein
MNITMKFSSAIEDILEIILSYLPVEDVNTLPLVREQWHEEMWKSLLHRKKYLFIDICSFPILLIHFITALDPAALKLEYLFIF